MSRITGTDALGLVEAYNAVYTPQELTEEQVWEEVESWVNSLLEEGYDLSEYTWEEMYEEYLNEAGNPGGAMQRTGSRTSGAVTTYGANDPRRNQTSYTSRFARPMNAGTPQTYGGGRSGQVTVRPQIGSLPSSARQVTQYPQGVSTGVGGGNAGASRTAPGASRPAPRPAPRPAAAPSAAAPRPAAAPSAAAPRPAAAPSAAPKATPPASTSGSTSTVPSISSQLSDIRAMRARSLERQGKPSTQMSHADLYDIVKGHLLDEGYADTEEAALTIMANMSEEWVESIVEENLFEKLKPGTRGKISFATGK